MKLYNSLSKKKEVFEPINQGKVGMYHCGPTTYDYVHVGNLRSFMLGDFLRRSFEFQGYEVLQIMNITDVGHLVSDGDDGEDKMTKALKREGKEINLENMIELAGFYAEAFKKDLELLNIKTPHHFPKASEHILEDIDIIKSLEKKGFAYVISDGVYFDTSAMKDYGKLGGISTAADAEARISHKLEKRNYPDFALWKFDNNHGWDSPWGQGFPGWHIECSGMSIKYLGNHFDIHTGGSDLRSIHHNNEIAQSECATGHSPFVNYWLHGEMLNFNGAKLSKSTGGNISLKTLEERGFDPLSYRYLALQTHYRSHMNFSWEILESAQIGLKRVRKLIQTFEESNANLAEPDVHFLELFKKKIQDDLNLPQALAVFHDLLSSDLESAVKLATLAKYDEVFGLSLLGYKEKELSIPQEITNLLTQRTEARKQQDWAQSDILRENINQLGFMVSDQDGEQIVTKK